MLSETRCLIKRLKAGKKEIKTFLSFNPTTTSTSKNTKSTNVSEIVIIDNLWPIRVKRMIFAEWLMCDGIIWLADRHHPKRVFLEFSPHVLQLLFAIHNQLMVFV